MTPIPITLPIGNNFYYAFALTNPDGSALTGKTDVTVTLSDTEGGARIAGLPAPYAAAETSTPGTYAVTIPGVDTAANVGAGRVGAPGWFVIAETAGLLASDPVVFAATQRVAQVQ